MFCYKKICLGSEALCRGAVQRGSKKDAAAVCAKRQESLVHRCATREELEKVFKTETPYPDIFLREELAMRSCCNKSAVVNLTDAPDSAMGVNTKTWLKINNIMLYKGDRGILTSNEEWLNDKMIPTHYQNLISEFFARKGTDVYRCVAV